MEMDKKVLVAAIAYNEEQNIKKTLDDLLSNNFGYDIILVDNGSLDNTKSIAEAMGISVLNHCINTGSSASTVKSSFLYSDFFDYDSMCQFDGDGQHIAQELPKIIKPIIDGDADMVIGSRFIEKIGFQSSATRRIGIRLFSKIVSLISKNHITDVTSGFRAYNKKTIQYFARQHKHELYDTNQFLLLAHKANLRIAEVPVVMKEREYGSSEFGLHHAFVYPVMSMISIVGVLLQGTKTKRKINGN